jgi:hypothetical protein
MTSKGMPKKKRKREENRTSQSSVEATTVKKAPPVISTGPTAKFHLAEIMIVFFSPRSIRPICKHAVIVELFKTSLKHKLTEYEYHLHRNTPQTKNPKRSR